jgi:hypothetical protein
MPHGRPCWTCKVGMQDVAKASSTDGHVRVCELAKVKQSHYTPMEAQWERWVTYSSYSILTSVLDGVSGQLHAPAALWRPVTIVQEAGWAPEPVWTQRLQEKSSRLCRESNLDRPVVKSVARHCINWATSSPCKLARAYIKLWLRRVLRQSEYTRADVKESSYATAASKVGFHCTAPRLACIFFTCVGRCILMPVEWVDACRKQASRRLGRNRGQCSQTGGESRRGSLPQWEWTRHV